MADIIKSARRANDIIKSAMMKKSARTMIMNNIGGNSVGPASLTPDTGIQQFPDSSSSGGSMCKHGKAD
ncbi:hypothetical protein E2562_022721 [Oryza meyeriana var. granulata]|uniref:Uncharacterized protein n=1 Tax=Oryza meyeriana var. granulata TaxID=110450 RepID=A0A6G1E185_9ORYZ|nr:hypothetical protein E2562_022721 [Oryza meyeriana var. granulata]